MVTYKKDQRISVYTDTIDSIKSDGYTDKSGKFHEFSLGDLKKNTRTYQKVKKTEGYSGKYSTVVYAQLIDCVQKAYEFGEAGALLNMASRRQAGGGVLNGSAAQEEEIFRRTTLGYSLYPFDPAHHGVYGVASKISAYPVVSDRSGIWSPGVEIFRKGPQGYYDYLVQPGKTNVITVPGVQKPELTEGGTEFKEYHLRLWKNKIRTVLRLALIGGTTKLVLGAWGCGAYGNPAPLVAKVFKGVLEEPEFTGAFEEICFAIIEDKNSEKGGNYAPFAKVFGSK